MTKPKILSSNFLIDKKIPDIKGFIQSIFFHDVPEIAITYFMHLSDGTVIKLSKTIKGYPTMQYIEDVKTDVKNQANKLYEILVDTSSPKDSQLGGYTEVI